MRWALVTLLLALTASPAAADAVRVSLEPRAQVGKGLPAVLIHIDEAIAGFELRLERSDGFINVIRGGGPAGVTRAVPLEQPEGRFHYEGALTVTFPDGEISRLPLAFDAELWGPLKLTVRPEDVDLEARRLTFRLTRAAARVKVTVLMDTGEKAFDGEVPLQGAAPGAPLVVTWPPAAGKVMRISLQAYDTSDFYTAVDLHPWRLDVPHEEVRFDSGRALIRPAERPKLDRSREAIASAVSRYGKLAALRLYILGHTDTVGRPEVNRTLSTQRARSIADYFRRAGVRLPIYYSGVGEEAPLVATPDETDEVRNRRAEYILSVEEPALPDAPFPVEWRRL